MERTDIEGVKHGRFIESMVSYNRHSARDDLLKAKRYASASINGCSGVVNG